MSDLHSGHTPHHHHHHHHSRHEEHHHHRHAHQDALEGCLQLLRGLGGPERCEAVTGHLLAALNHGGYIRGYMRPIAIAATHTDHYATEPPARAY